MDHLEHHDDHDNLEHGAEAKPARGPGRDLLELVTHALPEPRA
jgi:hypothetical protein